MICTKTSLELRQSVSLIYDTMTDASQVKIDKFFISNHKKFLILI